MHYGESLSASFPSQRQQLGRSVRVLRQAAGMNQDDLAAKMGCAQSTIAKIEKGYARLKLDDLEKLLVLVRADLVQADEMRRLAAATQKSDQWGGHLAVVQPFLRQFFRDEQHASEVRVWHSERIPMLFQSESYTLAMFEARDSEDTTDHLRTRVERQKLFDSASPPEYHVVFSESSFLRIPGGDLVVVDQVRRLLALGAEHDWLHIRVVPFQPPILHSEGDFALVSFHDQPGYVYIEYRTGAKYLDKPEHLHSYDEYWDYLMTVALSEKQTGEFLTRMLDRLSS